MDKDKSALVPVDDPDNSGRISLKNTKQKKEFAIRYVKSGLYVNAVCKKIDINRDTFYEWLHKDADFKQKVMGALALKDEVNNDLAESSLKNEILAGNLGAIVFWLCNRAPERWKNPQKLEGSLQLDARTQEAVDKIRELLNAKKDKR